MPNTKQAKKRMKTDDDRRMRNKTVRSAMRTAVKNVLQSENADEAKAAMPTAMKRVDKAAKKNIIHDNAAARKKSQLQPTSTACRAELRLRRSPPSRSRRPTAHGPLPDRRERRIQVAPPRGGALQQGRCLRFRP